MCKKILVIYMFFSVLNNSFGQSDFIKIKHLEIVGFLFKKEYEPNFILPKNSSRFTPTFEDILAAEGILLNSFIKKTRNNKKYYRQYIGYKCDSVRHIIVHMGSKKFFKKNSDNFKSLDKEFAFVFVGPSDSPLSLLYDVNLQIKQAVSSIPPDPCQP